MKLVGGDPCLDFVNSVGGRQAARVRADKLGTYADLVAFAVHAGLTSEADGRALARRAAAAPAAARAVHGRALALREALYRALRALMLTRHPSAADLALVSAELAAAGRHAQLAAGGGSLRLEWRDAARQLDSPLWALARAAGELLVSAPRLARLRQCGGADCGWLFLDQSRNRSRQWCTMEDCGNLSKVRRFRERHAARGR
jgi:predicted RNA-binding Zn ribbon-like protein